ncbi:hypothetical protein BC939DRAFT_166949 [Gamsiella multidivaricata]|uniref:uncharacterized protein n=1 Tax=Gamsiella multidivaricata TaxID=101098 RepID=UPI00221EBCA5|nr:uncharacterized protein BC939DRAFT_166949 [Gamsiella multidivaricata]KAI7823218.1 hypothetical protein BC939DRAFT_166949 [Gamsiella multidivaricata]
MPVLLLPFGFIRQVLLAHIAYIPSKISSGSGACKRSSNRLLSNRQSIRTENDGADHRALTTFRRPFRIAVLRFGGCTYS